jgi:DNA modification methylase
VAGEYAAPPAGRVGPGPGRASLEMAVPGGTVKPYYEQDGVTIYCGDCRDVLPSVKGDLVLTDPPYGVGLKYGQMVNDSPETHFEWFRPVLALMREAAPVVVFTHRVAALRELTDWSHVAAWTKPMAFGYRINNWLGHWEPIFVYGKPSIVTFDVFTYCTARPNGHPVPKPEGLMRHLLSVFEGGIVIDPFCGSGTTLVEAKRMGRTAIGVEINEQYCELAVKRLAQGALPLEAA